MRIGILGNGQLGAMLALAAHPMGHRIRFFSPDRHESTAGLGESIFANYNDDEALKAFAQNLDVLTFEFENVDLEALKKLSQQLPIYPPITALETSQDRLIEKNFFRSLGAQTPEYTDVKSLDELI